MMVKWFIVNHSEHKRIVECFESPIVFMRYPTKYSESEDRPQSCHWKNIFFRHPVDRICGIETLKP